MQITYRTSAGIYSYMADHALNPFCREKVDHIVVCISTGITSFPTAAYSTSPHKDKGSVYIPYQSLDLTVERFIRLSLTKHIGTFKKIYILKHFFLFSFKQINMVVFCTC